MTHIINGKEIANNIRNQLKEDIAQLKNKYGSIPGLAVVQVGNNPASSGPINLLNCHRNDSTALPLTMNSLPRISNINILLEGKSITVPIP